MLLDILRQFLHVHWDGHSPLLLGYSGGPDSKVLLYALLELGVHSLHVAHIDHGWREESGGEVLLLQHEIEALRLPFHTTRLVAPVKNKEALAREERFSFFSTLFHKISAQALLLAHHRDDQVETVLKRILEGAHLPFLTGIESISQRKVMTIWRPLLSCKKREIISFLEVRKLTAFKDPTNDDPKYLRARLRSEIIPFLSQSFGKEISNNLFLLSERAGELKQYLDRKVKTHLPKKGPWGVFCFLANLERIEMRHLVQKMLDSEGLSLSRILLEKILEGLFVKKPNVRFTPRIFIDRGFLFLLASREPKWGEGPLIVAKGIWTRGDWTIEILEATDKPFVSSHWRDVWSGQFSSFVPEGSSLSLPILGTSMRHIWNVKKVPAFLRYRVPIATSQNKDLCDFLSGTLKPASSGPNSLYLKSKLVADSGIYPSGKALLKNWVLVNIIFSNYSPAAV